ncbi:MAG: hypothetical protein GY893_01210, partial [bacterium]|nr:hypothetical protein [bacterium]
TSSASSATASASSATDAQTAQTAAETALDTFDDRMLGAKASNPSVDNDGNSLLDGAMYFNTTNDYMMVYNLANTTWYQLTNTTSDQNNINTVAGISSDVTATAGKATQIGLLGTADAISDMNVLGTSTNVTNQNTLAGISSDITTVSGISANVTTTAGISSDVTTCATNNANITTTASNISGVNSFADRYRVASSAPASDLDEGDLYFNTTDNSLYYYNGSAWTAIVTYTHPTGAGNEHLPSAISQTEAGYLNGVTSDIQTQIDAKVTKTSATGSASLPAGTTVQRDGTPSAGYLRWNTTDTSAEVYDGSGWVAVGGGNTTTEGLYEHSNVISVDYVIGNNNNALTAGPITINSSISVTIPSGSTWVIA